MEQGQIINVPLLDQIEDGKDRHQKSNPIVSMVMKMIDESSSGIIPKREFKEALANVVK